MKLTTRLILAASLTLALTGCTLFGGRPAIVVAADAPCTDLVPEGWANGVDHTADPAPAPVPPVAPAANAPETARTSYWRSMYELALGELKKWTGFGVAESQKVEDANGRTADTIGIVKRCEARDAAAVKKAAR